MRKSNIIKLYIGFKPPKLKKVIAIDAVSWGNCSVHFHCFCMYKLLVCAKLLAEIRLKAPKRFNMV